MAEEMSVKNTKNEILDAYHEVLQRLQSSKPANKSAERAMEEKRDLLTVASQHTADGIVKGLADLKISIVKSLEEIEEKLLSSHKKFNLLQQAIDLQKKDLGDIHDIKINADSLTALLLTQKEKSENFEKEMKTCQQIFDQDMVHKRAAWKKEQDEFELLQKERETQSKKSRQREEEEYAYQRDLLRQKQLDQYTTEKQQLEKELITQRVSLEKEFKEREEKIAAHEQEFKILQEKAERFPTELQKAVQEIEKTVTERLRFKYDYESKLAQKEVEGDRKLYQQMVAALEAKVAHLESQSKHLSDKTNQANLQVQDIAIKAIEGASRQRYSAYGEKTSEPVKGQYVES
jgi:hypothetical protein